MLNQSYEECKRLGVEWSINMCAIEEQNRQVLSQDCQNYSKFVHCANLANVTVKVVSGGFVLTTDWNNWFIVMIAVIVVKYCI